MRSPFPLKNLVLSAPVLCGLPARLALSLVALSAPYSHDDNLMHASFYLNSVKSLVPPPLDIVNLRLVGMTATPSASVVS